MAEGQKTHTLVKKPALNVRYLADYMAASEQAKRSILKACKYRATARMIQHIEAKAVITNYIKDGKYDPAILLEKATKIADKLTSDQFEEDTNKHNETYIRRFAELAQDFYMPECQIVAAGKATDMDLNGVSIRFDPALRLSRTTRTNKHKQGALMLRYQKGKALSEATADFQSAAILGLLKMLPGADVDEPDRALCLTLDAFTGALHVAPTKAGYLFKEMQAACLSIAERWDAIPAPKGAVF
jgi:hypothetical protein